MSGPGRKDARRTLADFALPSEPGNEREAMGLVVEAVRGFGLPPVRLERLKTAVAEATMNAMEHGNGYRAALPVSVRVLASAEELFVPVTDRGDGPLPEATVPDLEAKLEGSQTPRGWGLFLIRNLVDGMNVTTDDTHHTVELVLRLKETTMTAKPFEAGVRRKGGAAVVDLRGEIDGFAREALNAAYAEAEKGDPEAVLLDFEDVGYIDSTGIALIVGLLARARASKRRMLACGLSAHYAEIFDITRLSDFVSVYPDEESALTATAKS